MSVKKHLIDYINTGHASLSEIQDALRNGELTETELEINCGFDAQLIDRVKRFNIQRFYFSSVHDLPRLQNHAKDVYFIGMPNSGKTTILSSLLTHVNRIGKLKINTSNDLGIEYIENLIALGENGFCPISNYDGILIGCPILFGNYSKKNRFHSLNIIDIPGEDLQKIHPVTWSLDTTSDHYYENYFSNKNGKILIFTIDFFDDIENKFDVSIKLQYALEFLLVRYNFGPLIEAIYFVITKADLFPVNKEIYPNFAEEYISSNYKYLLNVVQDLKYKNRFEVKIIPYSIGSIQLKYLYETDYEKNTYIHDFPELLYKEICDTCNSRKYWFQRFI